MEVDLNLIVFCIFFMVVIVMTLFYLYRPKNEAMESIPLFEAMDEDWKIWPRGHYVYVIQDESNTRFCKIGRSVEPSKRLQSFGVILPIKTRVIQVIPCMNDVALENYLHERFSYLRQDGEWFALGPMEMQAITELRIMNMVYMMKGV